MDRRVRLYGPIETRVWSLHFAPSSRGGRPRARAVSESHLRAGHSGWQMEQERQTQDRVHRRLMQVRYVTPLFLLRRRRRNLFATNNNNIKQEKHNIKVSS